MLSIGERLAVCMARRVHVSDIKDQMVRALWWKRWEQRNAQIVKDCGFIPEFGDLKESAEREVEHAREARRDILRNRWALTFRAHEVAA